MYVSVSTLVCLRVILAVCFSVCHTLSFLSACLFSVCLPRSQLLNVCPIVFPLLAVVFQFLFLPFFAYLPS